jgi:hypothetical protein
MTKDEYIDILNKDEKMAAIERQIRQHRKKFKEKIQSYISGLQYHPREDSTK